MKIEPKTTQGTASQGVLRRAKAAQEPKSKGASSVDSEAALALPKSKTGTRMEAKKGRRIVSIKWKKRGLSESGKPKRRLTALEYAYLRLISPISQEDAQALRSIDPFGGKKTTW